MAVSGDARAQVAAQQRQRGEQQHGQKLGPKSAFAGPDNQRDGRAQGDNTPYGEGMDEVSLARHPGGNEAGGNAEAGAISGGDDHKTGARRTVRVVSANRE